MAAEHALVKQETRRRRNAHARLARARPVPLRASPTRGLRLALPGVVSWQRPREQPLQNGGRRTAYPPAYEAGRTVWRLAVRGAVTQAGWTAPPVALPLCVTVAVVGTGRFDLDRVLTALLDALQAGGALKDDCRVFELYAKRRRPDADETPHVDVLLTMGTPGAEGLRYDEGEP